LLTERSLSQLEQCCVVMKVYQMHRFLSLDNLNAQAQEDTKDNLCMMCEVLCAQTAHLEHVPIKLHMTSHKC